MLNPIYTEETECQDCYKCLRHCPVKTIEVQDGHARIMTDHCILCGNCVRVCPVGAKKIRNDLSRAKKLIDREDDVILSLAPSFISEFPGLKTGQLIKAARKLGFSGVSETALGAQEVTRHTVSLLNKNNNEIHISSACPTIVEYINKYQPQYASYVSESLSPLQTHCRILKQIYGEGVHIIFAGPCISKKREADLRPDLLSLAISFEDLRQWFSDKLIDPYRLSPENDDIFIPRTSEDGAYYPSEGGMIESIRRQDTHTRGRMLSFSNIHKMDEILKGLDDLQEDGPLFLELLACEGGCINGPAAGKSIGSAVKQCLVQDYAQSREEKKSDPALQCKDISYKREIPVPPKLEFKEEEIRRALRRIGKYDSEDEKNCGACGYQTCREYARAFLENRAEKDMCVSYLKKLSEKKANALIKAMPSGVVIVDQDMHIIECNRAFAKLIGPETEAAYEARPGLKGAVLEKIVPFAAVFDGVLQSDSNLTGETFHIGNKILDGSVFSIEKNQAVGAIFQDVTSPQVQKERIIRQAKQVMEKNIESVQQIAFLLGENAAESEVMLNTIIESFSPGGKGGENH